MRRAPRWGAGAGPGFTSTEFEALLALARRALLVPALTLALRALLALHVPALALQPRNSRRDCPHRCRRSMLTIGRSGRAQSNSPSRASGCQTSRSWSMLAVGATVLNVHS